MENKKEFWNDYLCGYNDNQTLPYDYDGILNNKELVSVNKKLNNKELSQDKEIEQLIYVAWSLVLGKYNNFNDLIFYTTYKTKKYPVRINFTNNATAHEISKFISLNFERCSEYITSYENLNNTIENQDSILFISFERFDNINLTNLNTLFNIDEDIITYNLYYNKLLFTEKTIQRICRHFEIVLLEIIGNHNKKIYDINLLSKDEYEMVINDFNHNKIEYDTELTIDELFEQNSKNYIDKTAVICGNRSITYCELNYQSNVLAFNLLNNFGIKKGDIIGIVMSRDIEIIITILAILKLGAGYVPVDPLIPNLRMNFMLENAKVSLVIVNSGINLKFKEEYNIVDVELLLIGIHDPIIPKSHNKMDLAYILYTSGSTGMPKGVAVEHKNVVGYIFAFLNEFKLNEKDSMLQQSTVSFDISVEEIFPILTVGGTLVIAKQIEIDNIKLLLELININKVTILSGFPLLLKELNNYPIPDSIKTMISGGDVLHKDFITNLINCVDIYNTYGPCETTVCVSYYKCSIKDLDIPIGKPIANYKIYILDKYLKPMPIGIPGIIYISGIGVSRGYYNQEVITKKRFIENPFILGERMYFSGDIGKWEDDGYIKFLGRIDNQVMVRGKRTELEEVQKVLLSYPGILEAGIYTNRDSDNNLFLTAYIVTEIIVTKNEIVNYLLMYLPTFMIPEFYVLLKKLPLNINGKIDINELPKIIK